VVTLAAIEKANDGDCSPALSSLRPGNSSGRCAAVPAITSSATAELALWKLRAGNRPAAAMPLGGGDKVPFA